MESVRVTLEALPANATEGTHKKLICFVKLKESMPDYKRQFIAEFDRDGVTLFGAFPAASVVRVPVPTAPAPNTLIRKWTMSSDGFKSVSLPPPTAEIPILVWCAALKLPLLDTGVERQDIWTRVDADVYAESIYHVFHSSSILRRVVRAYRWSGGLGSRKMIDDANGTMGLKEVTLVICGDLDSMTVMLARKDPEDVANMAVIVQMKVQIVQWKERMTTNFVVDEAVFATEIEKEAVKTFLMDSVTLALSRAAVVHCIRKDLYERFKHLRPPAPAVTCHCCGREHLAMKLTAHICRRCHQGVFCLNCMKDNVYMEHHGKLCNDRYWCLGVDLIGENKRPYNNEFEIKNVNTTSCSPERTSSDCRFLSVVTRRTTTPVYKL